MMTMNILKELNICKKKKEKVEKMDKSEKGYKKYIELMKSTLFYNNNMINAKPKIINKLKSQKNENKNDNKIDDNNNVMINYSSNVKVVNKEFKEVYEQLTEKEKTIKTKDEKNKRIKRYLEILKNKVKKILYIKKCYNIKMMN